MGQALKLLLAATVIGVATIIVGGCAKPVEPWPAGKSPKLLASFPPIYSFVKNVADDDAAVLSVLDTVGPHDHQPTVEDLLIARQADVLFINGLHLDNKLADSIRGKSSNPRLEIVDLGDELETKIPFAAEQKGQMHHGHSHGGEYDPHVWLGIPEAIHMVNDIRDKLKEKFPAKAKTYDRNAAEYVKQLDALHREGKAELSGIKAEDRKIIAFHDSLRYFARSFDFQILGVIEAKPGQEPSSAEFKNLVDLCKEKNVRLIAVEPQYPDFVAKRLVDNIAKAGVSGVKIVTIDPIETVNEEIDAAYQDGKDLYIRKMKQNITNLAKALP